MGHVYKALYFLYVRLSFFSLSEVHVAESWAFDLVEPVHMIPLTATSHV